MRITRLALALVLVSGLTLAACGSAQPAPPPPAAPAPAPAPVPAPAAEQPKPKGEITLYTSESQDQVNEMKTDFEAAYPGVKVNVFRNGTGPVIAKLQAEMDAKAVQADLIWFADDAFFGSVADKWLLPYDSAEAKNLPGNFKYAGGRYYEVRQIFNVVAYNTKKVTKPPTSWKDLTDPGLKGKVGMASPLYSGAAFSTLGTLVHLPDFGWDFYKALKDNEVKIEQGNGGVANKLASGEYSMVSVVDFMVRNLKNSGSPVDQIWPKEGAILIPTPVGIMKDSKNLVTAKAFVDYLLSERGQKLFLKQGYLPVKAGIGTPPGTPSLDQFKIAPTDSDYITKNREGLKENYLKLFPQ